MSPNVDGARLSDLSLAGWLGIGIGVTGLGIIVDGLGRWLFAAGDPAGPVVLGAVVALVGGALAYEDATPELEANCEHCGTHVVNHSGRNTADEVVEVFASGSPRRATVGPFSVVLQSREEHWVYCSSECAMEHDRVRLLDPRNLAKESAEASSHAD